MAAFNPDQKLEQMREQVFRAFDEVFQFLVNRRDFLLARLDKMREDYRVNTDLANAIAELRELKEGLKSNLLASVDEAFGEKLRVFENSKIDTENLEFVGFRCYSEKIRKAINEIDLYDLSPEYVGRENPFLTACYEGRDDGELFNPRGIALDRARNEVYVCDRGNSRIQVLSAVGDYVRQFGRHHLTEPHAICLSQQDELFVTDRAKQCVLKFSLTGEFLKQAGERGNRKGQFSGITGLCCEAGLVYVCDGSLQRILIFDSELKYIKYFGYGELSFPKDITILSDTIYILPQNENCIYFYNRDCTLQKKIELTGQEQLMTTALFFTIDKNGNFLIPDEFLQQIRIFSPKGVLRHILTGQFPFLRGITLDNFDRIICVCDSKECFIKF
eukprot:TRINITY_DN2499_c0_g1_i1.p1 TRINITY_DN2499_c0_g1~~TRINITY_DN2499_c0_g1_i1.p1  ORF type:complete len:388 (+),score=87.37 TRINITY_DN2499_c0_g1_i1:889-2052(+)